MEFIIIDYSDVYFRIIKKANVPSERKGKFIQLKNDHAEYVVFAPKELSVYHANIVERFCLLNKIEGMYRSKKKDFYEIISPEWYVTGGGMWKIDEDSKFLFLSGSSEVYGACASTGLKERLCSTREFSNYEVQIAQDFH